MKKTLAVTLAALLLIALNPAPSNAAVKNGAACKKAKQVQSVGRTTFTCVKVGGKLIWRSTGSTNKSKVSEAVASRKYEIGWICDSVADAKGAKDSKGIEIICVPGSDGVYSWRSRAESANTENHQQTPTQKVIDYSPVAGNPCNKPEEVVVNSAGVEVTCGVGQDKLMFWYAGDQTPKAPLFGNENVRASMRVFPRPQINKCTPEPGQEYQYYRIGQTLAIDPFDSKHLFAAVERLGIYESLDGGDTWQNASTEGILFDMKKADNTVCFKEIHAFKFDPKVRGRVYLQLGGTGSVNAKKWQARGSGLYVSNDNGKNWEFLTSPDMHSFTGTLEIDPKNSNILYMGGASIPLSSFDGDPQQVFVKTGLIYKSTDAGKTWVELNTGWGKQTRIYTIRIDPDDSQKLLAPIFQQMSGQVAGSTAPSGTGLKPGFYQSSDGGTSWSPLGTTPIHQLSVVASAISADGKSIIFMPQHIGYESAFYSNDAGKTFTELTGKELLMPTFAPGSNTVAYAILKKTPSMSADQFVTTIDAGRTWSVIGNSPAEMQYNDLTLPDRSQARPQYMTFDPNNSSTIYLAGAGGKIARSTDLGKTWKLLMTWEKFPAMNIPAK